MILLMVVSVVAPFLSTSSAEAFNGRAKYHGYFGNKDDNEGGFVIRNGIHPTGANQAALANDFINEIVGHLNGTNSQDQTGAEFIILTMLGRAPGTSKATAHNAAVLADWEMRVRYYASQGWVDWTTTAGGTVENTYWQGKNGGGSDPDDVAWYTDAVSGASFTFHKPGSPGWYEIRKECGNPLGDLNGLEAPDYSMTLTADRNGSPYSVVGGKTYSLGIDLKNNGPATSETGVVEVKYPASGIVQPCAANCNLNPPTMTVLLGGFGGNKGFRTTFNNVPGQTGANWYWDVKPMGDNKTTSGSMQFTVAAGAVVGSIIHFDVYYYKGDLAGAIRHVAVEYKVVSERAPGVAGNNADIHAGGGICKLTQTAGSIKGYPGATSGGQYVVSASATNGINNFTSNGTGANNLKVGNAGSYSQVCRPDLLAAATAYFNAGVGYNTIGGNDFDATGKSGVWFYNGGNLTLHGTVGAKLTVVALTGAITISGPVVLSNNTFAPRDSPSLGVIAKGNIEINASVTRVDAYLFSNAVIDTCKEASLACATPQLLINGFIMAHDIALHRLGPLNTNGTPISEQVTLNPQIYLNPPKFFDASVDATLLEGQGERPPLF